MTVDDVIFSLNRVAHVKGSPSFLMDGVTVSAGGKPGEVVLTTASADPGLPYKLTNPASGDPDSKVIKANGGLANSTASTADKADAYLATASVGSGPYVLGSLLWPPNPSQRTPTIGGSRRPTTRSSSATSIAAPEMIVIRGDSTMLLTSSRSGDRVGDGLNVVEAAGSDIAFLLANFDPAVSDVTTNKDFREAV